MKASPPLPTALSYEQKRNLLVDLMAGGVSGVRLCPLSLSQQRLWFLDQLEPGTAALNLSSGLRLKGELNTEALQRSVSQIVARHETLRTDFLTARGEIFQRISPTAVVEIPTADLRAVASELRESAAYRMTCEEAARPFDLHCAPLLRMNLIRMQDNDHILIFTMHHLIGDGWSIEVFVEELLKLYEAEVQGGPYPLPPIRIQYADHAEWQRECLDGEESARQAQYWKQRLAGLEPLLELPSDRVRPAEQSFSVE